MTARTKVSLVLAAVVLVWAAVELSTGEYRAALIFAVVGVLPFVLSGIGYILRDRVNPAIQVGWGVALCAVVSAVMWVAFFTEDELRPLAFITALGATAITVVFANMMRKVRRRKLADE
jgi:Ca2+/H+ antiporter